MFEARRVLQEMSKEIRTLSYLLHPPVLDELGLASAIEEYAGGFSERSGIQLEVDLQPGFGRLSQEAETAPLPHRAGKPVEYPAAFRQWRRPRFAYALMIGRSNSW